MPYTYVLAYALIDINSPHFSVIHTIVCMLHTLPIHIVLFSCHVMEPVLFLQHLFISLILKASIVFLLSSLCRCLMRASYYCPLSWMLLPCKFEHAALSDYMYSKWFLFIDTSQKESQNCTSLVASGIIVVGSRRLLKCLQLSESFWLVRINKDCVPVSW